MKPFSIRKNAADFGDAKTWRSLFSSRSPRIPAGIVPTTSSHASFASVSAGSIPRSREPLHDSHPVGPEEAEQDERRRQVRRDEEGDEVRVVLVDVPAEQARQDHAVAQARDRKELRHALKQPEDDRL